MCFNKRDKDEYIQRFSAMMIADIGVNTSNVFNINKCHAYSSHNRCFCVYGKYIRYILFFPILFVRDIIPSIGFFLCFGNGCHECTFVFGAGGLTVEVLFEYLMWQVMSTGIFCWFGRYTTLLCCTRLVLIFLWLQYRTVNIINWKFHFLRSFNIVYDLNKYSKKFRWKR